MRNYRKSFQKYADTMREIRRLSAPSLTDIASADDYSRVLRANFNRIGELAEEDRKVIREVLMPILDRNDPLTEDQRNALEELAEMLVDADYGEEIDAHISRLAVDRLVRDKAESTDQSRVIPGDVLVEALDREIENCYTLMDIHMRAGSEKTDKIRKRGLRALKRLSAFLEKDRFSLLSTEARATVMVNSYYGALLYENDEETLSESYFKQEYRFLKTSLTYVDDPFYREQLPDNVYNWTKHGFGARFYLARLSLSKSITKKRAAGILSVISDMEDLWGALSDAIGDKISLYDVRLLLLRVMWIAGSPRFEEMSDRLITDYRCRDITDYSNSGIDINLDVPAGYLSLIREQPRTEELMSRYRDISGAVLSYMLSMPKRENLGNCITEFARLIRDYTEYPGGVSFEDYCIRAMAAIHPPTHVHSRMTGKLSVCLARHLLKLRPEAFIGIFETTSAEEVTEQGEKILNYTYHAALCHDIGKLLIIDTVAMYGRDLLDDEMASLRQHPIVGAEIAKRHLSTESYVDVIRGHHLWYDGSTGYPADFDKEGSPYRTVIDLVAACDSMDAATDSVGRSYRKGKSFEEFEREVSESAGTRYAPWLPELLKEPAARKDIIYLLTEGRSRIYKDTFRLLRSI